MHVFIEKMIDDYCINIMVYCLSSILRTLCLCFKCPGDEVKVGEWGNAIRREADA